MKLTAKQFKARTELDPDWCSKLTEPIEVTEYLDMEGSNIQSLSPLIAFTGDDGNRNTASFWGCKSLKVATGTFNGYVEFRESGVERIENLKITQPNEFSFAASFFRCQALKIATGTYFGGVSFEESGVEIIENLKVTQPDEKGWAASFGDCKSLKVATGTYPGYVYFGRSGVERIENLEITQPDKYGWAAHFQNCAVLEEVIGKFSGKVDLSKCPNLKKVPAELIRNEENPMDPKLRRRLLIPLITEKILPNGPEIEP